MKLWIWSLSNIKDIKIKTRTIGASTNMKSFNFMFACKLVEVLLRETDMLPYTLQEKSILTFKGKLIEFIGYEYKLLQ